MALSKKIKLPNGLESEYFVVSLIETNQDLGLITVHLDGFIDKEHYKEAIKKTNLIKKQIELLKEFDELSEIEEPNKTQKSKLDKLQANINKLADEIDATKDYELYKLMEIKQVIPMQKDLSLKTIQKALIQTEELSSAAIVA